MFNDLKPVNPSVNENNPPVDDIFADTDKDNLPASAAPGANPDNSGQQFSGYYANQTAAPETNATEQNIEAQLADLNNFSGQASGQGPKKNLKLIGGIVAFILLIVLGYLVYSQLIANKPEPIVAEPINNALENEEIPVITPSLENNVESFEEEYLPEDNAPVVNPPVSEEVDFIPSVPLGTTTPPVANMDSDGDGLSDQQEIILGTNPLRTDSDDDGLTDYEEVNIYLTDPLNPDSDGDGLSDYEEIKIYKTDPLNSDSDNDGYSDKTEIDTGYNPNGPGKLSE